MPSSKEPKIGEVQVTDLDSLQKKRGTFGGVTEGMKATVGAHNIVTIEVPKNQSVQSYEPGRLHDSKGIKYSTAMKGVDMHAQRNSRFRIHELTRGPLSVEEEEEQRIEAEVQRRLMLRLEELHEVTRQAAYQEGLAAGKQDAKVEVLAEAKPMLEKFEGLVQTFDGAAAEIFKANEEYLIHMTYQLAKHVILRELQEDSEYTKRLVRQLLERIGTRENIKIFVGEAEFSSADVLKQGLAQSLGELKNISVELDPEISGRGCRVETEFGEIDAQIDVQIQSIAKALGVSGGNTTA